MAATKSKKKTKELAQNGAIAIGTTDVLTLAEAAAYLRISEADVLALVRGRGLIGRQIGEEWRFLKSALQTWLNTPERPTGNEALLALAGCWKDDPDAEEMLREIYKNRGRPMIESSIP